MSLQSIFSSLYYSKEIFSNQIKPYEPNLSSLPQLVFFQIWTDLCLTIFGFIPFLFTHPGCVFEIYKMKITLSLSVSWILTLNMLRFLIFISLVGSLICQNNPPNILFILADDLGDFLCIITFYNKGENMRHFFLNAQIHLTPVLTFSLKHLKKCFENFNFIIFKLIQIFAFLCK